ncbi:MFS transporter [Streptomyces sp. NPDC089919]|uniref:MFS transporter n=1 Tax=Streptomyces sp. NPDC089919 TaxID=3155188 RepID=UPI00341DA716
MTSTPRLWGGELLRHRDFRFLWGAQAVSLLGSQVTLLALPLTAVTVLDAGPFETGLLGTAERLPYLCFGLLAGVWVDRLRRRPLLVAADLGRALLMLTIPVASLLGVLGMGQLYAVGFLVGLLAVLFDVAHQSMLPSLVRRDQLLEGNSKLEFTGSTADLAGPGAASLLIGLLTAPVAIVVDAVSYLASALLLSGIAAEEPPAAPAAEKRSLTAELREGLAWVSRQRLLRWVALTGAVGNVFIHAMLAVFFLFLLKELDLGTGGVAAVVMTGSIGAMCSLALLRPLTDRIGTGPSLIGSTLATAAGVWLLALAGRGPVPALAGAAAANFVFMLSFPLYNVTSRLLRQSVTPDHLMGRVSSIMRTVVWGTMPIGSLLGGALGSLLGLRAAVLAAACGLLVSPVLLALSPLRALRTLPEHPATEDHEPPATAGDDGTTAARPHPDTASPALERAVQ